ncbi:MerR family transcriptional regulator [Agromyces sp. SYSU K20354]|uniref:MerR family transcriptional regulator n=1 Tax=Agromyces cavernae TaxID=2898659 RepID=UPI001E5ED3C3|nr:MerR family transcriptional regulator [Agromyces cavernae]MCD2442936.1 MerR family transcriptional regulator [Agromyces cavernae]
MPDAETDLGLMSTAELAGLSGYSVQQVRDLERLGVIPPARRGANGYRQFSSVHIVALRAYRDLALAVGPVEARQALRAIRRLPLDPAAALINSFHVTLARARDEVLAALRALDQIRAESTTDSPPDADDAMTITELAAALGVRSSTLRFWERQGLVAPERVTRLNVRRYPGSSIREARITAALRSGGYGIPEVRALLHSIREFEGVDDPHTALHERLDTIAKKTLALLTAGTDIVSLIADETADRPPTASSPAG